MEENSDVKSRVFVFFPRPWGLLAIASIGAIGYGPILLGRFPQIAKRVRMIEALPITSVSPGNSDENVSHSVSVNVESPRPDDTGPEQDDTAAPPRDSWPSSSTIPPPEMQKIGLKYLMTFDQVRSVMKRAGYILDVDEQTVQNDGNLPKGLSCGSGSTPICSAGFKRPSGEYFELGLVFDMSPKSTNKEWVLVGEY